MQPHSLVTIVDLARAPNKGIESSGVVLTAPTHFPCVGVGASIPVTHVSAQSLPLHMLVGRHYSFATASHPLRRRDATISERVVLASSCFVVCVSVHCTDEVNATRERYRSCPTQF